MTHGKKPLTKKMQSFKAMKFIKARKPDTCHDCKSSIKKGDDYVRRSMSIGKPQDSHMENIDGIPTMVMSGIIISIKVCKQCAELIK
jgi:hypothetical protein